MPDAQWIKNAHGANDVFQAVNGSMPVKYAGRVWGCGPLYDPGCLREWNKAAVYFTTGRKAYQDRSLFQVGQRVRSRKVWHYDYVAAVGHRNGDGLFKVPGICMQLLTVRELEDGLD